MKQLLVMVFFVLLAACPASAQFDLGKVVKGFGGAVLGDLPSVTDVMNQVGVNQHIMN
jgi:hypothetical protein